MVSVLPTPNKLMMALHYEQKTFLREKFSVCRSSRNGCFNLLCTFTFKSVKSQGYLTIHKMYFYSTTKDESPQHNEWLLNGPSGNKTSILRFK